VRFSDVCKLSIGIKARAGVNPAGCKSGDWRYHTVPSVARQSRYWFEGKHRAGPGPATCQQEERNLNV
jgi:hypothetical protein